MKPKLDMSKIAKGLGAERRGKVSAGGGYFGAIQLAADVQARFRTPARPSRRIRHRCLARPPRCAPRTREPRAASDRTLRVWLTP